MPEHLKTLGICVFFYDFYGEFVMSYEDNDKR